MERVSRSKVKVSRSVKLTNQILLFSCVFFLGKRDKSSRKYRRIVVIDMSIVIVPEKQSVTYTTLLVCVAVFMLRLLGAMCI